MHFPDFFKAFSRLFTKSDIYAEKVGVFRKETLAIGRKIWYTEPMSELRGNAAGEVRDREGVCRGASACVADLFFVGSDCNDVRHQSRAVPACPARGGSLLRNGGAAGDIGFYLPMFLLVAITNPLFSHNGVTPLFFLNGNPVTLEAFVYGAAIAVTVIGAMLWCKCYSAVMTSDKFLWLFARVIPKLALVLSMALRFLPMLRRQMKQVKTAQKTMGLYSARGVVDRIRSTGRVFLAVIGWALENAMETAASMRARGYGTGKRTNFSIFRFTARDGVLSVQIIAECFYGLGILPEVVVGIS